ncbi:MAG: hypothetical protein WC043_04515 [Pseudobdellovibrionaceae bacterium]
MKSSFHTQRNLYLNRIKGMLNESYCSPWSIVMQHETCDAEHILKHTASSTRDMTKAFKMMLESLEGGQPLEALIEYKNLPYYEEHRFAENAAGGAASALRDAALLIVSFDPSTFASHSPGRIQKDLICHLNGTLHLWLLSINHQWQFIKKDATSNSALLNATIPPPEQEKATLSTMFKALCHSLHIGPLQESPFVNEAALAFGDKFKMKLWPFTSSSSQSESNECSLEEISVLFQHWYFSVGKTQITQEHPKSSREAEDIFIELRTHMHECLRTCHSTAKSSCDGNCTETAFSRYTFHPFGQQCYNAAIHIARNLAS